MEEDKVVSQIFESYNYEQFVDNPFNRNLAYNDKLTQSMIDHGSLKEYPVVVYRKNNKLIIKDGHTRYYAAKELGLPIRYTFAEAKDMSIFEINDSTKPWKLSDYLVAGCNSKIKDYLKINEYCEETGFSLSFSLKLFSGCVGTSSGGRKSNIDFKRGIFEIVDSQFAESLKNLVKFISDFGVAHSNHTSLITALSKCLLCADFNVGLFKKKIKKYAYKLEKRSTIDEYLDVIEDVYNYNTNNKDKIALKTLIREEMIKRRGKK